MASIAESATIGENVYIGPFVYVGEKAVVGDNTVIEANVSVGDGTTVGRDCILYNGVTIYHDCKVGNRCVLHAGSVVGSDGFGFLLNKETGWYDTIDQVGIVVIGDRVDIGANTTIDRARFGRTVIGDGTKLDNQIQIGHNVTLGKHCVMCAQSGIAGSTHVGDYVTIAAQCGITGHIRIEDKVVVAARSGVMNTLEAGKTYWGAPAVPYGEAARQFAAMRKLPEAFKELRALKAKAEEIQELINQALAEQA
jgi:UDP-3-O-[3-hydroxymyristoyl] glucosamine N-acyltransferase